MQHFARFMHLVSAARWGSWNPQIDCWRSHCIVLQHRLDQRDAALCKYDVRW